MKWVFRRAAAVALAAALCTPSIAAASSKSDARVRDKTDLVLRVINKLKRTFGVSANADALTPPLPPPTPPPPPSP